MNEFELFLLLFFVFENFEGRIVVIGCRFEGGIWNLRFDCGFLSSLMGEESEGGDFAPKNVPSSVASEAVVVAATASLDAPAKKLARQLDFTGVPEQSQSQPQPQPQPPQQQQQMSVTQLPPLPPQAPLPSVRVG